MSACELAKTALEAAYVDGVKQLFVTLHLGLVDGNAAVARSRFVAAMHTLSASYDMATCVAAEVLEK